MRPRGKVPAARPAFSKTCRLTFRPEAPFQVQFGSKLRSGPSDRCLFYAPDRKLMIHNVLGVVGPMGR